MKEAGQTSSDEQRQMDWRQSSPPPLYKYVAASRALKILKDGEIRLTQPRHLNDPHELSVEINPQSVLRDYYEFLLSKGVKPKQAADMAKRNIIGIVIDRVKAVVVEREQVGILSLSESYDNMLMWAHYGEEHRGTVLELDASELITECSDPDTIQLLNQVTYSDQRVDFIAQRLPLWMTLAYKSTAWAYEREWRLFKSLTTLRHKVGEVYVVDVPPRAIKRVIFGARAAGPEEEEAINLIQQSPVYGHVEICKTVFKNDLIGLDLKTGEEFALLILHGQHHFGEHWRELRQWVDLSKMERAEQGDGLP